MQTKYYNEMTRLEEWRCRYYSKTYLTLGSTSGPAAHLEEYHQIPKDSKRNIKALNVQKSLQQAFTQAEANP